MRFGPGGGVQENVPKLASRQAREECIMTDAVMPTSSRDDRPPLVPRGFLERIATVVFEETERISRVHAMRGRKSDPDVVAVVEQLLRRDLEHARLLTLPFRNRKRY